MANRQLFIMLGFTLLIISCSSPKYFHDKQSYKRQKELQKNRSANVSSDIFRGMFSIFSAAALDLDVEWDPSQQEFKKIKLINPTSDTMYINMLTDIFWDENDYCDFMDIRIPPNANCKVLVPVNANYNLYFSNTPQNDDDEMLEIFTDNLKQVALYPGITLAKDSVIIEK